MVTIEKLKYQLKKLNTIIQVLIGIYLLRVVALLIGLLFITFVGTTVFASLLNIISMIDTATTGYPFSKIFFFFFIALLMLLASIGLTILILLPIFKKIYKTLNDPKKYETIKTVTIVELVYIGLTLYPLLGNYTVDVLGRIITKIIIATPFILRLKTAIKLEKVYEENQNNEEQDSKTIQEETKNTDKSE